MTVSYCFSCKGVLCLWDLEPFVFCFGSVFSMLLGKCVLSALLGSAGLTLLRSMGIEVNVVSVG